MKTDFFLPYPERAARAVLSQPAETDRLVGPAAVTQHPELRHVPHRQTLSRFPHYRRRVLERSMPHRLALTGMNFAKRSWSHSAARRVGHDDAVFAFPGAALELFAKAGSTRILHAVDAHPRAHNEHLHDVPCASAEVHPHSWVRRIEREIDLATDILVPSARIRDQFLAFGAAEYKLRLIPYGVDLELFRPHHVSAVEASRPRLLFVGQISWRKGADILPEVSRYADLTVVGNAFDRGLERRLSAAGVNVRSSVTHAELAKMYNTADAFFLPTREDACALVTLEAAAAGLPVITTDRNGATEVIDKSSTRVFSLNNRDSLLSALSDIRRPTSQERERNRAASVAAGLASWDTYARRVREVIEHG